MFPYLRYKGLKNHQSLNEAAANCNPYTMYKSINIKTVLSSRLNDSKINQKLGGSMKCPYL